MNFIEKIKQMYKNYNEEMQREREEELEKTREKVRKLTSYPWTKKESDSFNRALAIGSEGNSWGYDNPAQNQIYYLSAYSDLFEPEEYQQIMDRLVAYKEEAPMKRLVISVEDYMRIAAMTSEELASIDYIPVRLEKIEKTEQQNGEEAPKVKRLIKVKILD